MSLKLGLKGQIYVLIASGGTSFGTRATWKASPTNGIYEGPATVSSGVIGNTGDTLNLLTRVGDELTQAMEKEVAEANQRDTDWVQVVATIRKGPLAFKMFWDPSDAAQLAMLQAFSQSGIYVPALVVDDLTSVQTNNYGTWADWEITKFSKSRSLKDPVIIDVEMQPSAFSSLPPQTVSITVS